jgi:tetratricopeptide (TPR) repeat protein
MADVKIFLSCVSDEFGDYRDALRKALTLPNVAVKIQEDFKPRGGDTLRMLQEYIEQCEAVVHFAGDMDGSTPKPSSVNDLLARRPDLEARLASKDMARHALAALTYTQWEAWLAVALDRDLFIVAPADGVARGPKYAATDASCQGQKRHLDQLRAINRYPAPAFTSVDNLVAQIATSALINALVKAAAMPTRQVRSLPFSSSGARFVGRADDVANLHNALASGAPLALTGLGGVGKTRLAVEYALKYGAGFTALLFLRADDPTRLSANLAALTGGAALDLPEKEAREDEVKLEAVLRWLEAHPTWLMILDNVDDEAARNAVIDLLPRLGGGKIIITARATAFPDEVVVQEIGVLDEGAAAAYLLVRTEGKRAKAADDIERAGELARELDGLALGLQQAGAYMATRGISFARYLGLWRENRRKVVDWFDRKLMSYDRETGLAATWATSVARLSPESRRLLDRLAFLAPDPVPDLLLDVAVPSEASDADADEARAGLYAYSLISGVTAEDGGAPGFIVHRLVQDFTRRALSGERYAQALREALAWVNAAFVGDPADVRSWPVLDALAPHALAVARHADTAEIAEPTSRLLNELGVLFDVKADYAEAEELKRRALAIVEKSYGPDHSEVAIRLNNLAVLFRDTNRPAEAEPLMRRALAIDEASSGPHHPDVAIRLNNLAQVLKAMSRPAEAELLMRRALAIWETSLRPNDPPIASGVGNLARLLHDTNRLAEAEPLMRRALAINEKSNGPHHPEVAVRLNNLAGLLLDTNRTAEAEPLFRRALAIDETSYGPDHPRVARDLNNLGGLLNVTNRGAEAQPLMRRALAILEQRLGLNHPNTVIARNNVAALEAALRGGKV